MGSLGLFEIRNFWDKMEIPYKNKKEIFEKFYGKSNLKINNADEAISYLRVVLDKLQAVMVSIITTGNSKRVIFELLKIQDKCFNHYCFEKEERREIIDRKVDSSHLQEIYGVNRNIALDLLYGINIWLENAVLLQQKLEEKYDVHIMNIDVELCLLVYVYGTVSRSLSFLTLSKNLNSTKLYYGLEITPQSNMPINVLRYHPVIYYNPLMAGNQNVFNMKTEDFRSLDNTEFGRGFANEYNISLLDSLRVLKTFQKNELEDGRIACMAYEKKFFIARVNEVVAKSGMGERFLAAFSIDKEKMVANCSNNDPIIWKGGVHKYRFELRPIVLMEDDTVCISYQAFEQTIQIWMSYYSNGGVAYSDIEDLFTEGEERRNRELSHELLKSIVQILKEKYPDYYCDTNVKYERIFGSKDIDYGDYDIVFFAKDKRELFLIESKYFSDSLNISGHINDFVKLIKKNGYYEHCRKRYDLVLENTYDIKRFIGVSGNINMHCLFIPSKPLEIEFQDDDKVVTFVPFGILEQYLDGKIVSEDGSEIIRPTILI